MIKVTHHQRPVTPYWGTTLMAFLAIPLLSLLFEAPPATVDKQSTFVEMLAPNQSITRWNRMSSANRSALNDNDPLTNVTGFHTGYEVSGNPLLVDISAKGAENAQDPTSINNRFANRWGLQSFNNGREEAGNSGSTYCFDFNVPIAIDVNSLEHQFFHNGEHVFVSASLAGTGVNLTGSYGGVASFATIEGNGTDTVGFHASGHYGTGLYWAVHSNNNPVDRVCVEYYRSGNGMGNYGREPFTLSICDPNAVRVLLDDPFAISGQAIPPAIRDNLTLTKETLCVVPADTIAGNVEVTFRMFMDNISSNHLTNIQLEDDLRDHLPTDALVRVLDVAFGPGNDMTIDPVFKNSFDGVDAIQIFNGTSGRMEAGDRLVVDLTIEMDPNVLGAYDPITNHTFSYGIDPNGSHVTATSDSPTGYPGDTNDPLFNDGLLLFIPAVNATLFAENYETNPSCNAGDVRTTLVLNIQNTGNVDLDELSAQLDLASIFGSSFVGLVDAPEISPDYIGNLFGIDGNYTGLGGNTELIELSNILLAPGDSFSIKTNIQLDPNAGIPSVFTASVPVSGRGLFPDQSPLPGCFSGALLAVDTSDVGLTPEDQNNSFTTNSELHNDPFNINLPNIGLSKRVVTFSAASSNMPGNLDVTYRIVLKNTGNTSLQNITLTDDLMNMLGTSFINVVQQPSIVSSDAAANPSIHAFPNIFNGSGGVLLPNQVITVDFKIEMDPDAIGLTLPINNAAFASANGTGIDGSQVLVSDESDGGTDPEGKNVGYPGDTDCDNDPLVVQLPAIRVAQHIVGVHSATSGINGHFDLTFQVLAQNVGSIDLTDLSLVENLSLPAQLGNALYEVVATPQIIATGVNGTINNATTQPDVNGSFNGALNNDLLTGGGLLEPGQIYIVAYRVEVNPDAAGAPNMLFAQVNGFGTGAGVNGSSVIVNDLSDAGYVPQSNNTNAIGNSGNSNDPTPVTDCYEELSGGISCNNGVQVSLNMDCMALLTPEMVLEGEIALCANSDLLPLGTYYEIIMVKDLTGLQLPDLDPSTPNVHEIDGGQIGKTLSVKVGEIVNGNYCWGFVTLEDKMGPVFDCPTAPISVACDEGIPALTEPPLIDNCDPNPVIQFAGELILDNDICDGVYIVERMYTGKDQYDNPTVNHCTVEIHLERGDVVFPTDVTWHCDQYNSFPGILASTNLHPSIVDTDLTSPDIINVDASLSNTVLENTGSGVVANTGGLCDFNVFTADQTVVSCGNTFEIVRTWTVIDWCSGAVITTDVNGDDNVQLIRIEDHTAPVITRSPFEVNANSSANNHPFLCVSQGFLPPPESVTDNCNNPVTIQIITPVGVANYVASDGSNGGFIPSPGLPIGQHDVEYRATDACGNSQSIIVEVTVADNQIPTAVCDEITDVNLTTNGTATVFASTFDDGSNDNCCIDHFEVRRMVDPCSDNHNDLLFGSTVIFCCNDVDAGPQMVVFRVYDCNGNFNDCMVEVQVNDQQGPQLLSCPSGQSIDCEIYRADYDTQLDLLAGDQTAQNELLDADFGTPSFMDNCGFSISKTFSRSIDQCGEGTMTRTWRSMDSGGMLSQQCSQEIQVHHVSDWVVEFPADISVSCGDTLPSFGNPTIFNESCEMIATFYEDDTLNIVPNGCFEIVRTWAIINWCTVGDDVDEEVVEAFEADLGLAFPACDLDGDGDCDNRTFRDSWNATDQPGPNLATQQFGPDTDPDSDPWDGYITYQQRMIIEDTVDPVFTSGCDVPEASIVDAGCAASITLPTLNGLITDCSPSISISVVTDIPGGFGFGPYLNVPPAIYNVTYTATDNCNNQTSCSTTVEVVDRKNPTVKCKPGLVLVIMDGLPPSIDLNAAQLDDGSGDDCSTVTFSFTTDVNDTDTTFLCHQVGTDSITIYVTDENGNQDFCKTEVTIQADSAVCVDDPLVVDLQGVIDTEMGQPVEEVTVHLTGQSTDMYETDLTGGFEFGQIAQGLDLTIAPEKNDAPLNGVTTYDLVLISKHILGVESLNSPYKMIAADANRSGSVTTFDLVEIRKLVLHVNDEFPNNSSWRFIPEHYQFPDPQNPWAQPFPEVININNIPTSQLDADFIAVKIGDVNGSVQTNMNSEETADRGENGVLVIESDNQYWKKDDLVTVALTAEEFAAIGFQFTLQFDTETLAFVDAQPCLTDAGHLGRRFVEDGFLTVSWNDHQSNWQPEQPLLHMVFRALKSGELSRAVSLTDRYTPPEAYNLQGDLMSLQLEVKPFDTTFELLQNVPNPFSDKTTIGFRLAESTTGVLTITDVSGRLIKTMEGSYPAGYSEIQLNRKDLPASGILYYRLDTPDHTDTKMMLLVNGF